MRTRDGLVERQISEAGSAASAVAEAREATREDTVTAIRILEKLLLQALDEEPLRGLRNICPRLPSKVPGSGANRNPLYAARVRAGVDEMLVLPLDGYRETLCIVPSGELVIVTTFARITPGEPPFALRAALDEDFEVQDLEALARTLQAILPRHIELAKKSVERYTAVQRAARAVERELHGGL